MIRLKTRNNGSKLNSLLVVLIIALQGVVALSSSLFNPGEMNRESGYFSSFPGAHFSSNSTNFTFSNFSTIVKNVSTPSVRIQVNNSQEGLLIGSEKFAYSSDGSFPMNFGNPHDDNFSDGEFAPYWFFEHSSLIPPEEKNGDLRIFSTADQYWGEVSSNGIVENAPFVYQRVIGDFSLNTHIIFSINSFTQQDGGVLFRWEDGSFRFIYMTNMLRCILIEHDIERILISRTDVASNVLWLNVTRQHNNFTFSYSYDGTIYEQVFTRLVDAPQALDLGVHATKGADVFVSSWDISPDISCTGDVGNVSTSIENITVNHVPFNNWRDGMNKIVFSMSSILDTSGQSDAFLVDLDAGDHLLNFSNFTMINDDSRDVHFKVRLEGGSTIEPVIGTECFAISDHVLNTPPMIGRYMNPHVDDFSEDHLLPFWGVLNNESISLIFNNGSLLMQDVSNGTVFNGASLDAPFIYQNVTGNVNLSLEIGSWNLQENNSEIGIALVHDSRLQAKFFLFRNNSHLSVGISSFFKNAYIEDTTLLDIAGMAQDAPLTLKINKDLNTTTFSLILPDESIKNVGSVKVPANYMYKVGFFVANTSTRLKNWDISPNIVLKIDKQLESTLLEVTGVSFPTTFMKRFTVAFNLDSSNGSRSHSTIYHLEVNDPQWKNKALLFTYGLDTVLLDNQGDFLFSAQGFHQLDSEYLNNGHVLVTSGTSNDGRVVEYDQFGKVVRSFYRVEGGALKWPHDADMLDNGNLLITDTRNDRVIEVDSNGNLVWEWNVWDYFDVSDARDGTSHVNDADRLPNGNTLISVRNLDTVVEVNPKGDVVWMYGRMANSSEILGQHNPTRLTNGDTLICDSEHNRLVEINLTGNITWTYNPTQPYGHPLGWVRDADLLPNNHVLIGDGYKFINDISRILEINKETGDILWELETPNPIYDVDLVDIAPPETRILSPVNSTYHLSRVVDIVLDSSLKNSKIYHEIRDDTTGLLINDSPVEYNALSRAILENGHSYTLFAWSITTLGDEENMMVANDYHFLQNASVNISFTINLTVNYSARDELEMNFLVTDIDGDDVHLLNKEGNVLYTWDPCKELKSFSREISINDAELLPDGRLVVAVDTWRTSGLNESLIIESDMHDNILWSYSESFNNQSSGFIDVDLIPASNGFMVSSAINDEIFSLSRDKNKVVIWNASDYEDFFNVTLSGSLPLFDKLSGEEDKKLLVPASRDNTLLLLEPGNNVSWYLNQSVNSSSIFHPENALLLSNGSILLVDAHGSGLLIEQNGSISWNSSSFTNLSLINASVISMAANKHIYLLNKTGSIIYEATMNGIIVNSIKFDKNVNDFDLVYFPTPFIYSSISRNTTFHQESIPFTVHSRVDLLENNLTWRISQKWENGSIMNLTSFTTFESKQPLQASVQLSEGDYILEVKSSDTLNMSVFSGSDDANFFLLLDKESFNVSFQVEISSYFCLSNAPVLFEGLLSKSEDDKKMLAWTRLVNADNYTVFASSSPVHEIDGSDENIVMLATTNETWFVLEQLPENTTYYAVIAVNHYYTSPVSNNIVIKISAAENNDSWLVNILKITLSFGLVSIMMFLVYYRIIRRKLGKSR
ncbi:MAG: aryl-sulfate sulfotransferase [Promethearchaeota archaeon]